MTPTDADLAWIGIWLLVVAAIVIVAETVLAGIWSARIARHSQDLSARLAAEQSRLHADVERLREALAETAVLWQPYGRLLRWLSHPLAIALMQSYARRRAACSARCDHGRKAAATHLPSRRSRTQWR